MSDLTEFSDGGFDSFADICGTVTVSIASGPDVSAIKNEDARSRDWETGGWDQEASMRLVVSLTNWIAAGYSESVETYQGQLAAVDGKEMRVIDTSIGAGFVQLGMGDKEAAN